MRDWSRMPIPGILRLGGNAATGNDALSRASEFQRAHRHLSYPWSISGISQDIGFYLLSSVVRNLFPTHPSDVCKMYPGRVRPPSPWTLPYRQIRDYGFHSIRVSAPQKLRAEARAVSKPRPAPATVTGSSDPGPDPTPSGRNAAQESEPEPARARRYMVSLACISRSRVSSSDSSQYLPPRSGTPRERGGMWDRG
jgi:hypothetical protein